MTVVGTFTFMGVLEVCFIGFWNWSNFLLTSHRATSRFSFPLPLRFVACLSTCILLLYSNDCTRQLKCANMQMQPSQF